MTTLGWTENVPSGSSNVGVEPAHLHSLWTAISLGLSTDLYWDGSGGASSASRGELRPGASRTYVDVQSASSNSNNATQLARAFFASDTSRLFVYDSTGTFLGGTPYFIDYRGIIPNGLVNDPPRAISGSTTVSNVTTTATSEVTVFAFQAPTTHSKAIAAFASCSDRSVLVRTAIRTTIIPAATVMLIQYRGTTNAPSTTTFYWHLVTPSATGHL